MAGQPNMYSRLFWMLIMHVSYFWAGIVRAQERSKNPLMWRWESQHGCIHCGRAIWCLPTLSWLRVRIDYNYLAARLAGQVARRFFGRWFLLRETNTMNTGLYHPFISIYSDFGGTLGFFFPVCPPVRHEQPNGAVYHVMGKMRRLTPCPALSLDAVRQRYWGPMPWWEFIWHSWKVPIREVSLKEKCRFLHGRLQNS
jgi:hypothetical protein